MTEYDCYMYHQKGQSQVKAWGLTELIHHLVMLNKATKRCNTVGFVWVPAQGGAQGSEDADRAAKRAISRKELDFEALYGITGGGKLALFFNAANNEMHTRCKNGK